jgi:hypothetical protein
MQALDARNRMSHTYSAAAFGKTAADIRDRYFDVLETMHRDMSERAVAEGAGLG